MDKLNNLIKFHSQWCQKIGYGKCEKTVCIRRGNPNSMRDGISPSRDLATCEYLETVEVLRNLKAAVE